MSDDGIGHVFAVAAKPRSRVEIRSTASDFGQTRITLNAGVLGTVDGAEVIRRASDVRTLTYSLTRPKRRPGQEG